MLSLLRSASVFAHFIGYVGLAVGHRRDPAIWPLYCLIIASAILRWLTTPSQEQA
jgi:hypothetical protein